MCHHQTILRILSSAATASVRWRVRELNCPTTYTEIPNYHCHINVAYQIYSSVKALYSVPMYKGVSEQNKHCYAENFILTLLAVC